MSYQCPICGFKKMRLPPRDQFICACCGTEFGVDDLEMSHWQLRQRWQDEGMQWFSSYTPEPNNFDPIAQLASLGELHIAPSSVSFSSSFRQSPTYVAYTDAVYV